MRRSSGVWFIYAILIVLSAAFLLPLYWMVRSSFMDLMDIFAYPPKWVPPLAFDNYQEVLKSSSFGLYFINTLTILIPTMLGTVLTSAMAAFGFARMKFPLRNFWFSIVIATMLLPGAVTMIPAFVGWSALGFTNSYTPLILPAFFGGGAFNIFLIRQFMLTLPRDLDESAYIDGAGYVRIFTHIILPLLVPVLVVVNLFTFIGVWNDFLGPLLFLTDSSKYTLAIGLMELKGSYSTNWGLIMAGSTMIVLPPTLVFLFGQRYFIEGISTTGVKG